LNRSRVVVVLRRQHVHDAQVRLVRSGVDHAAGWPVGAVELAGAEHDAVGGHDLEVAPIAPIVWRRSPGSSPEVCSDRMRAEVSE
jgi:hypothetical protein